MTVKTEIFTDGACRGNPGPGGWGAILRFGDNIKEIYGGEADTTNNRMELTAVIRALQQLKKPVPVRVTTDSTYVLKGSTEWLPNWKKNNWKTSSKSAVKNADLWQELDKLLVTHEIEWKWVKGHSGHAENERVDELANLGIDNLGLDNPDVDRRGTDKAGTYKPGTGS